MTPQAAPILAPAPAVCEWLGGRGWVYSITFDEALSDLHRFAVPILAQFGVPGHVEVVVGQMGEVRRIGASSFNGFKHMDAAELRDLLARGWGVGNHSWSHTVVDAETAPLELGRAREVLEAAIGRPVTVYCSPGSNVNMNDGALAGCRRHGYLGAMSITDALNRPDASDPLWLNRTFLHTQAPAPFFSAFDPFRALQLARRDRGWVIDYLHCPLDQAVHPHKDCSAAELRERIETVVAEGGDDVWLAPVEAPIDYRYARRHVRLRGLAAGHYALGAPGLPNAVTRRTVTLALPSDATAAQLDGRHLPLYSHAGRVLVDVDVTPAEQQLRLWTNPPHRAWE